MDSSNLLTAIVCIAIFSIIIVVFTTCKAIKKTYISRVNQEFSTQPLNTEEILTEADISHLPETVKKYIVYSGAIGKSKPQQVYIEFDAKMIRKPGGPAMNASSEQYNFFGSFTRLFFMKANMVFVPFHAFHAYADTHATFVVRVASLFNAVDIAGQELTEAETVTLLNDMCLFVPGSLIDKRLSWKEIDSLSTQVTLENGPYKVSAILYFNTTGELVNFVSEDRYALQDDGTLRKAIWMTPVKDYKEVDGRRLPSYGEAIWKYPEGDFTYGMFTLKRIQYNMKGRLN